MIKIVKTEIYRFRSIMKMTLSFDKDFNLVTFCGKNNVGKTNTLRAINLFFHPEEYEPQNDMPIFKVATGGASVYPKITITFWDDKKNEFYEITRNWETWNKDLKVVQSGKKYKSFRGNKPPLSDRDCQNIISKIQFYYLEASNMIIPELINEISEEMLTNEFNKTRFSNSKRDLKKAYDSYVDGLQAILDDFADSISETFGIFKNNWNVKFVVPKNSDTFRELISDDVELTIDDQGTLGIDDKGSGLQRLAAILLQFEAGMRNKKGDSIIFCVDEPDIFLHEGLQRKLKQFFDEKAKCSQIMYTTHSKIFIDTYNMKNIMLLDAILHKQYSARKKREINVVETGVIDLDEDSGYEKICENLGIEKVEYNVLDQKNILVEGNCDKKYIENLMSYFDIKVPKVISANGASNIARYLEFYEAYYKDLSQYKSIMTVVYDNDAAGREAYEKNSKKKYTHIDVKHYLLPNYIGDSSIELTKNTTNNEIEDFMYPEVMCYLVNEILKKKGMNTISTSDLLKQLGSSAFRKSGFMSLCEHYKNSANPENGEDISFTNSGKATNQLKESLAGVFELEGNRRLIKIIEEAHIKYPNVKEVLVKISNMFENDN